MNYLFPAALAIVLATSAFANLDETLQIKYTDDIELFLGVGVDEFEPSKARQVCLEFTQGDVILDVAGSTDAKIVTRGVFDIDDFENDFNFDYSVETTTSAGVDKLFNVSSTVENTGKFALFLKNYVTNIGITIDATANHGSRRVFYAKGLKPEFQDLINSGNFEEFRERCGTHFVSSQTLVSEISVSINADSLSRTLKNSINQSWIVGFGANGTFEGLTAGVTGKSTTTLSNVLSVAQQHGSIAHNVQSRGGYGIGSISAALSAATFKPEEIQTIYKAISEASDGFTVENADPDTFNLISYDIFGAKPPTVDTAVFRQLDEIYKRVVRIDAAIEIYKSYQSERPTLYTKYFKPAHDTLTATRSRLVSAYTGCRSGGSCVIPELPELEDLVFVEDIFLEANYSVACVHGHSMIDSSGSKRNYMSSADFVVRGALQFLEDIDVDSVQVIRNSSGDKMEAINFDPSARLRIFNQVDGRADVLIQLDTLQIPKTAISNDQGVANISRAVELRSTFREIAYIVRFGFTSGLYVDEVFALPDLRSCAISSG